MYIYRLLDHMTVCRSKESVACACKSLKYISIHIYIYTYIFLLYMYIIEQNGKHSAPIVS